MSSLGDAKSSLGDAKSSLGDAESSLGVYAQFCLDRLEARLDMDEVALSKAENNVKIPSVELITSACPHNNPSVRQ
jgi:hypothetical protein